MNANNNSNQNNQTPPAYNPVSEDDDQSSTADKKFLKNGGGYIPAMPSEHNFYNATSQIKILNGELNDLQTQKNMLDAKLCKLPTQPKKLAEKEKKDGLEKEMEYIVRAIGACKKKLRDLQAI